MRQNMFDEFGWINPYTIMCYSSESRTKNLDYSNAFANKFDCLQNYCKQWNNLNFCGKIELLLWMVDSPSVDYQRDFAFIPNQAEMKSLLRQLKGYGALIEGSSVKRSEEITEKVPKIYEYPIDSQISFAIGLCITDLSGKLREIYDSIKKGETEWIEFWELVKATSICIQQEQSFDVVDKMSKWVIGKQRNKKIEEIFEEI